MMHTLYATAVAISLLISSTVSIVFTSSLLMLVIESRFDLSIQTLSQSGLQNTYTYEGEDVPVVMPFQPTQQIRMVVEESVHYSISDPEAMDEWIYSSPYGTGGYRLGPNNRAFYITMFHNLHCLRLMRSDLLDGSTNGHSLHCLRYLREQVLCGADTTLEPGDFTIRDFDTDREGETHVCRDWREVYAEVNSNWSHHLQYLKATNFTGMVFETSGV